MCSERFRSLARGLASASEPSHYVFRALRSPRIMSFERFGALALCLSSALDVFRALSMSFERSRWSLSAIQTSADYRRPDRRSSPTEAAILGSVISRMGWHGDGDRDASRSSSRHVALTAIVEPPYTQCGRQLSARIVTHPTCAVRREFLSTAAKCSNSLCIVLIVRAAT